MKLADVIEMTNEYARRYEAAYFDLMHATEQGRPRKAANEVICRVRLEEAVRREERISDERENKRA